MYNEANEQLNNKQIDRECHLSLWVLPSQVTNIDVGVVD